MIGRADSKGNLIAAGLRRLFEDQSFAAAAVAEDHPAGGAVDHAQAENFGIVVGHSGDVRRLEGRVSQASNSAHCFPTRKSYGLSKI